MDLLAPSHEFRHWRKKPALLALLFIICLHFGCPTAEAQCDSLKSGDKLWIRLTEAVSSYSARVGNKVVAMVIESRKCEGAETIAAGTPMEGEIKAVRRVGMGLVHETAMLEVEFNRIVGKDGSEISIGSRVVEIDNARETVKDGVIHGINATDTPQGRITNRLKHLPTWNPYSDLALVAYRAAFPVFPEPEIYLPRGTDLKLELTADLRVPAEQQGGAEESAPDEIAKAVLEITAGDLPERTTTRHGEYADIVNVALLGTKAQMDAAFRAAGWRNGDAMTPRSVLREAHAFLAFNNYPSAPMTRQLVDGQRVSATWEKGLDSYAKREHLRLWEREDVIEGQTVWLGAMTRETGATLSVRQHKFIHHIDAHLDEGRGVVARDLSLAGCVAAVYYVQRPDAAHAAMNATGDPMRTDGSLAVVQLKNCENPVFEQAGNGSTVATRPHSKLARYLRMQVLSFKSDLIRGNVVYGAFDLTRMIVRARRNHSEKALVARLSAVNEVSPERAVVGDADARVNAPFVDGDD
jgi:LssY C-terminus